MNKDDIKNAAKKCVKDFWESAFGKEIRILSPDELPSDIPDFMKQMEVRLLKRTDGSYGTIIIDRTSPGTHETYNVLFNSQCQNAFWATIQEALDDSLFIAELKYCS